MLIFLSIWLVFLSGCRSPSSERPPGYLVVGIESYPLQLDPRYSTDANSVRVGHLIYNSLLRSDERSRLRPELAREWRMLGDRTYVFNLRNDVKFHDGRPLTAADVKFTYESILNSEALSPKRGLLTPLRVIELTGPHQVRFHLNAPHAPFIEQFTVGIVPAGSPIAAGAKHRPPPGSGPFRLQALESGERVTLRANPDYWGGRPLLDGVVFKIVPDAMVRVAGRAVADDLAVDARAERARRLTLLEHEQICPLAEDEAVAVAAERARAALGRVVPGGRDDLHDAEAEHEAVRERRVDSSGEHACDAAERDHLRGIGDGVG